MIGDWVLWKNKQVQVVSVSGIKYEFNHYDVLLAYCNDRGDGIECHDISSISPIPLTPDILKKNGCTMIDKGDYGEWHIKENPNIPLWQHTEFIIFGGIEIHFVHQFQHALRLCGLDSLSDNFKID